jgi:hypothetical protein
MKRREFFGALARPVCVSFAVGAVALVGGCEGTPESAPPRTAEQEAAAKVMQENNKQAMKAAMAAQAKAAKGGRR